MINLKSQIINALSESLENVVDTYPVNWENLPQILCTEKQNKVYEYVDDKESMSLFRYRIDIWNSQSTTPTAMQVDEILSTMGFKRTSSKDVVNDISGLNHKIMKFEAVCDVQMKNIYHKNEEEN